MTATVNQLYEKLDTRAETIKERDAEIKKLNKDIENLVSLLEASAKREGLLEADKKDLELRDKLNKVEIAGKNDFIKDLEVKVRDFRVKNQLLYKQKQDDVQIQTEQAKKLVTYATDIEDLKSQLEEIQNKSDELKKCVLEEQCKNVNTIVADLEELKKNMEFERNDLDKLWDLEVENPALKEIRLILTSRHQRREKSMKTIWGDYVRKKMIEVMVKRIPSSTGDTLEQPEDSENLDFWCNQEG